MNLRTSSAQQVPIEAPEFDMLLNTEAKQSAPQVADQAGAPKLQIAKSFALGLYSACAVNGAGAVWCWGRGANGQLGNGAVIDSAAPVTVTGIVSGAASVALGRDHACAVLISGALKCWGSNSSGQLGNGSIVDSNVPVDVSGLSSGVKAVTAGEAHTCALTTAGAVKCWGRNSGGQIGNNQNIQSSLPLDTNGLNSGVTQVVAGVNHTCALLASGLPRCWGNNANGQLGNGSNAATLVPVIASALPAAPSEISLGNSHTCAIVNGGVLCWGENSVGQLGNNSVVNSLTPVTPNGLGSGVRTISAGYFNGCVTLQNGNARCWGDNGYSQLGDGSLTPSRVPVPVSGTGYARIHISYLNTCVELISGGVMCWGWNEYGQLGIGVPSDSTVPVSVLGLSQPATSTANGTYHACAISGTQANCWGWNVVGQLGDGTRVSRNTAVPATVAGNVQSLALGFNVSCAHLTGGAVRCWGYNDVGQLGAPAVITESLTGVETVNAGVGVQQIAVGVAHGCARAATQIRCWGSGSAGQNGLPGNTFSPVAVAGLVGTPAHVSAGTNSTCASNTAGQMQCWGSNQYGQLGVSTATLTSTAPLNVAGLPAVSRTAAGGSFTCALTTAGGVYCWGDNRLGQLGNGTNVSTHTPQVVDGLSAGVTSVVVGLSHACALTNVGGIKCWGDNRFGSLGIGSEDSSRLAPVDVPGLTSGVIAISANFLSTCAVLQGGAVRCWGEGSFGQLGDGNAWRSLPVLVKGFRFSQAMLPLAIRETFEELEPNNTSAQANLIASGKSLRGVLNDNFDFFVFDTTAAGQINVTLNNVPPALNGKVQLQLYFQNTGGGPVVPVDSSAPYALSHSGVAGRYYIAVFADNSALSPANTYDVAVTFP